MSFPTKWKLHTYHYKENYKKRLPVLFSHASEPALASLHKLCCISSLPSFSLSKLGYLVNMVHWSFLPLLYIGICWGKKTGVFTVVALPANYICSSSKGAIFDWSILKCLQNQMMKMTTMIAGMPGNRCAELQIRLRKLQVPWSLHLRQPQTVLPATSIRRAQLSHLQRTWNPQRTWSPAQHPSHRTPAMTPKLLRPAANLQVSGFLSSKKRLLESQSSKRTRPWQKVRLVMAGKNAWRSWVRSKPDSNTSCHAVVTGTRCHLQWLVVGANEVASKVQLQGRGQGHRIGCRILCPMVVGVLWWPWNACGCLILCPVIVGVLWSWMMLCCE